MTGIELMLTAYIECALWSSNDESTPQGGEPLDKNYGPEDISEETRARMRADVEKFWDLRHEEIGPRFEDAGHDLWLTRNGHGCGFWDGNWPEPDASELDESAKRMGEVNLYVGDDGRIYS